MLMSVIIVNHESVQITVTTEFLQLSSIPIRRIQSRRNRTYNYLGSTPSRALKISQSMLPTPPFQENN
jgi:hypothetical protein